MTDEQVSVKLPIMQEITGYSITCVPEDNPERYLMTIRVEKTGPDRWAVRWSGRVLNFHTKAWSDYEPLNSSRTDEWKAAHRTDLETALIHARALAPHLRINGMDVQRFINWHEEGGET